MVSEGKEMQDIKNMAIARLESLTKEELENLIGYLHNVINIR